MKITEFTISRKTAAYFIILVIIGGGIWAYQNLGKLEFPTFTIKTAVVVTQYSGASAVEVEQEVTNRIEVAIQAMSQVKKVRSISKTGLSIIYVDLKNKYDSRAIPQIWDELRRKVGDAQMTLPPGAGPSVVNDDFGDEYGVFFALTGEGYTYEELKHTADYLKRELLLVDGVASVATWGDQQQIVELVLSRGRMAELGVGINAILNTLNQQNTISDSGRVEVDGNYVRINPTGGFPSIASLGDLLVQSDGTGNLIYLKDVVTIRSGYQDPPDWILRFNGQPAIGLGIATVDGGNVVRMGQAVRERLNELMTDVPLGMQIGTIAYQSDLVAKSVRTFLLNLLEAVAIVIVVLCITMGLSSGLLMGAILILTIFGTFIGMKLMAIDFQMISLGALVLALGMLVDNAIVVTEGILVRVHQGRSRKEAAIETVSKTALPLLGATIVAVLAFAAIGTSQDTSGEFLKSLFQVMAISLGLSWVLGITLTPLFCVQFLPRAKTNRQADPYGNRFYRGYRRFLDLCLRHRIIALLVVVGILVLAMVGFSHVEQDLFPNDSRNQFMIDYWRSEGTHIEEVSRDLARLEQELMKLDDIIGTATFVGRGALRFLLMYEPQMANTSYGQILATVKDSGRIDDLIDTLRNTLTDEYPDARIQLKKFRRGSTGTKIEARFVGPDIPVLRLLSEKAEAIMASEPTAIDVHNNWRDPVQMLRPIVVEAAARRLGITRPQISNALAMNFSGKTVGIYRQGDTLLQIKVRAPLNERASADDINDIVVFSPITQNAVPLRQIVSAVAMAWEDPIIQRVNRRRAFSAFCNPAAGTADTLLSRLRPKVEAIALPAGYTLEWGGDFEHSNEARRGLFQLVPVYFLAMVMIVIGLFNGVKQTVIIFLCLPLVSIGVTAGLLLSRQPFGFMCILGYLGLSGMIIKNAVVLIDQIDAEIRSGKQPYSAILDSAVSRLRPVAMASLTTVLGMLPLLQDIFFVGMSITIIGGLTFGTILTLIVVPVLYALFFTIRRTA